MSRLCGPCNKMPYTEIPSSTTAYTTSANDGILNVAVGAGDTTITVSDADGNLGQTLHIRLKSTSGGNLVINRSSSDNFRWSGTSGTSFTISSANGFTEMKATSANLWQVSFGESAILS